MCKFAVRAGTVCLAICLALTGSQATPFDDVTGGRKLALRVGVNHYESDRLMGGEQHPQVISNLAGRPVILVGPWEAKNGPSSSLCDLCASA
jgi:hypothetical protein